MAIITTRDRKKQPQTNIRESSHPAAMNKLRCPKCGLGFAIKSPIEKDKYTCDRCQSIFVVGGL